MLVKLKIAVVIDTSGRWACQGFPAMKEGDYAEMVKDARDILDLGNGDTVFSQKLVWIEVELQTPKEEIVAVLVTEQD